MEIQYFELQGRLLEMAIDWLENVFKPHLETVKATVKSFRTERMIIRPGFFGRNTIVAIGDDLAPIEGMVPAKDWPGYLRPNTKTKRGREISKLLASLTYPECGEPVMKELGIFHQTWVTESRIYFPNCFQVGDRWFVGVPAMHVPERWLERDDLIPIMPMDLEKLLADQSQN
ncbi:MAG: hypothetical protein ACRC62_20385 [Microcoleus sp.]